MAAELPKLNEALRLLRVFHDMSRPQLQKLIGISPSYLSEIESGQRPVTMKMLEKYSEGFNIPLSSLLLFSEQLDPSSRNSKIREALTGRVLAILLWIEAREQDFTLKA